MPFIRYKIEDMGIFVDETCTCGRGLPVFRMEAGRASDFLISPYDKSNISGCSLLHHLIAEGPEVGQIQVIQDKINHLTLKIVKSGGFQQDKLVHFDGVIERIFKGQMTYDIEYVTQIEREKSKKYFFTKCLITKDEFE
jgi:phenylacetate-CoA ligase